MAARFWVGGSGNINDTAHWSATTGGAGGVSVPTLSDTATFDLMSNATAYTVTMNATFTCSDLTVGAPMIGAVTFSGSGVFDIYGSTSIVSSTVMSSATGTMTFRATSGTKTISTNGTQLASSIVFNGSGGTFQLTSALTTSGAAWTRTAGTFASNSQAVEFNGGIVTMTGSGLSFANLTFTGTAATNNFLSLSASITVTGTFTMTGNSAINRVLLTSATFGTAVTVTVAALSFDAVDLRDITKAGVASGDISGAANYTGDCGGNTGWTFTTAAAQTWSGTSGGNWSANAWTSRVPLPQDDVTISSAFVASQTVTTNLPRSGKSITWANTGNSVAWAKTTTFAIFGSLTMTGTSLMTQSGTNTITFAGRSDSFTITNNGQTFTNALTQNTPSGTLTMQDSFLGTAAVTVNSGTFVGNGFDHTAASWTFANTANVTATLGTGTYTATGVGTVWSVGASAGMTGANADISVSNTSAPAKTVVGNSRTYRHLKLVTGTGTVTISGDNSFSSILSSSVSGSVPLAVTAGSTQTITGGASSFSGNTSGGTITCTSATPGTRYTITSTTRLVCSYLSLTDCNGAGSGVIPHVVSSNATDGGNNLNWAFPRIAAIASSVGSLAVSKEATSAVAVAEASSVVGVVPSGETASPVTSDLTLALSAVAQAAEVLVAGSTELAVIADPVTDTLAATANTVVVQSAETSQVATEVVSTAAVSLAQGATLATVTPAEVATAASTVAQTLLLGTTAASEALLAVVVADQTLAVQDVSQEADAAVTGTADLAADVALAVDPVSTAASSAVSGAGVFAADVEDVFSSSGGSADVTSAVAALVGSVAAPQAVVAVASSDMAAVLGTESAAADAACLISAAISSGVAAVEKAAASTNLGTASLAHQLSLCRLEVVISTAIAAMQDLQWDEVLVSLTPHYLISPVPRSRLIGTARRRVSVAGASLLLYSLPGTGEKRLTVAGTSMLLSTLEGAGDRRLTLKGQARVN